MNDDSVSQGTAKGWNEDLEARLAQATSAQYGEQPKADVKEKAPEPATAEEKQPEPMPSSDQTSTKEEVPAKADGETQELPEGTSERTKEQFDKFRRENRELKERLKSLEVQTPPSANDSKEYGSSVFDSLRSDPKLVEGQQETPVNPSSSQPLQFLTQQQVDNIAQNFVDQYGNVDVNGLNKALADANNMSKLTQYELQRERQQRIELQNRMQRFEESHQEQQAYSKFPQIDPKNKEEFDPNFFDLVRVKLLENRQARKDVPLVEVAQQVSSRYKLSTPVNLDKVKEEAITEYKATLEKRKQGPIEPGKGEPRDQTSNQDIDKLRQRTRAGDGFALDERLRKAGILS